MKGPVTKVCDACHQAFECGQYGCWCTQISITEQQMIWIEQSFHDCLCPRCLQQVAEGKLGPSSSVAKPQ
ncbi:MAG TPA: cysteine-rich CWC family protein [Nitrospira sp.]|jgi:Cysteine-rich CWC|nr:cysteine-rich CWC family protein [Nitrospira sp.]